MLIYLKQITMNEIPESMLYCFEWTDLTPNKSIDVLSTILSPLQDLTSDNLLWLVFYYKIV